MTTMAAADGGPGEPQALVARLAAAEARASRLAAVIDLGFALLAERSPSSLLERFCAAAAPLADARCVVVGLVGRDGRTLQYLVADGVDAESCRFAGDDGVIARLWREEAPVRCAGGGLAAELPVGHPPLQSFLGVRLGSPKRRYGWLYFGDKAGGAAFGDDDERIALTLAAQLVLAYEALLTQARLERHSRQTQRAEGTFRALLEAAPDAMVVASADGRITFVNSQTEKLFGYTTPQLVGQPLEILVPERCRERHVGHRSRYLAGPSVRPMGIGLELSGRRRDGSEFPVEIGLSPLVTEHGLLITAAIRDISERKRAEARLQEASLRLQRLSNRVLEAQEAERRRIAHELHDEIGQALTAIKLILQVARQQPDHGSRLDDCIRIAETTLQQVRSLSLDLRPPQLEELGLAAALRWHVDRLGRHAAFTPHVVVAAFPHRLHPAIETACFRVAQEALTNVVRHSGAREVWVLLNCQKTELRTELRGELHLRVRDDGCGFEVEAVRQRAAKGESIGLIGMEERVMLAGGRFELKSAPGTGTEVHAILPFPVRTRADEAAPGEAAR